MSNSSLVNIFFSTNAFGKSKNIIQKKKEEHTFANIAFAWLHILAALRLGTD